MDLSAFTPSTRVKKAHAAISLDVTIEAPMHMSGMATVEFKILAPLERPGSSSGYVRPSRTLGP